MGVYNQAVITNAGEALIAAAIAGGSAITFSAMQTSDVAIPDGTDLKTLTALPNVAQAIDGQAVSAYVLNQNLVQVSGRFSNTQIEVAYYVQAIGVFARSGSSDVLVAVVTAVTPDEMPVYNPLSPTALIYNVQLSIQDADTMTISVDDTGTASIADIARLEDEIAKKIDILGGDASDAVITTAVPNATDVPVPAAGDTFKVILGKIQKFFADIKKAFTGVSASGRTLTFTAADGSTKSVTTQDTWIANSKTAAGYVAAPTANNASKVWKTDANGNPAWRDDANTTYGLASTSANGLLKKLDGNSAHYMRGDGTWATPPDTNTTYSLASTSANGLLRKLDGNAAHYMRGDGTWATPPDTNTTYGNTTYNTNGLFSAANYRTLFNKNSTDGASDSDVKYCFWQTDGSGNAGWRSAGAAATTSHHGLMSPAMVTKLNGIDEGATVSGVTHIAAGTATLASSTSAITTLASKAVSAKGTYLVMMTASCSGTADSGYLKGCVHTAATAWGAAPSWQAFNGSGNNVTSFYVYTINSSTTFYALCQQSSGASRAVLWNFSVIRLA